MAGEGEEDIMKLESVDKNITIQSSNIDLGSSLTGHARESILRVPANTLDG